MVKFSVQFQKMDIEPFESQQSTINGAKNFRNQST